MPLLLKVLVTRTHTMYYRTQSSLSTIVSRYVAAAAAAAVQLQSVSAVSMRRCSSAIRTHRRKATFEVVHSDETYIRCLFVRNDI